MHNVDKDFSIIEHSNDSINHEDSLENSQKLSKYETNRILLNSQDSKKDWDQQISITNSNPFSDQKNSFQQINKIKSLNRVKIQTEIDFKSNLNHQETLDKEPDPDQDKINSLHMSQDPFNKEDFLLSDSHVSFQFKTFLKQFIYHILYYFTLGPFITPLILLIENKNYVKNMGFYPSSHASFYFQIANWMCLQVGLYLFLFNNEKGYLGVVDTWGACLCTFMQCFIIAFRYSTTPKSTLQNMHKRVQSHEEASNESLTEAWKNITPTIIDQEIKSSMIRNEVENFTFTLTFLTKLKPDVAEKLRSFNYYKEHKYDSRAERKKIHQKLKFVNDFFNNISAKESSYLFSGKRDILKETMSSTQLNILINEEFVQKCLPTKNDLYTQWSGRLFMKEVFLTSKAYFGGCQVWLYVLMALVRALIPCLVTLYFDIIEENLEKYNQPIYYVYTIVLFYLNFLSYFFSLQFVDMGIIDMQRRLYFMQSLVANLEPNRQKVSCKFKISPVINYFDPKTLLSWMYMRILLFDIGKKFFFRIQLYITTFIIIYGVLGGLWILMFFGLTKIEFSWIFFIFNMYEIINLLTMILIMLNKSASVNYQTDRQIMKITELKNTLDILLIDWDRFCKAFDQNDQYLLNNTFKNAYLYFEYLQADHGEKYCIEQIKKASKTLDLIESRLEREKIYNPIKFMGIPITSTIINGVYTSLISILFAMINKKAGILSS